MIVNGEAGKSTRRSILVVDDYRYVRDVVRAMLVKLGYTVYTAENGQAGLDRFREHASEIGLVFTDIVMPEMDGITLYHRLKAIAPDISLVVMTAYPQQEGAQKLLESGLVVWLEKPIRFSELKAMVERFLGPSVSNKDQAT